MGHMSDELSTLPAPVEVTTEAATRAELLTAANDLAERVAKTQNMGPAIKQRYLDQVGLRVDKDLNYAEANGVIGKDLKRVQLLPVPLPEKEARVDDAQTPAEEHEDKSKPKTDAEKIRALVAQAHAMKPDAGKVTRGVVARTAVFTELFNLLARADGDNVDNLPAKAPNPYEGLDFSDMTPTIGYAPAGVDGKPAMVAICREWSEQSGSAWVLPLSAVITEPINGGEVQRYMVPTEDLLFGLEAKTIAAGWIADVSPRKGGYYKAGAKHSRHQQFTNERHVGFWSAAWQAFENGAPTFSLNPITLPQTIGQTIAPAVGAVIHPAQPGSHEDSEFLANVEKQQLDAINQRARRTFGGLVLTGLSTLADFRFNLPGIANHAAEQGLRNLHVPTNFAEFGGNAAAIGEIGVSGLLFLATVNAIFRGKLNEKYLEHLWYQYITGNEIPALQN
jgi:hypothetical protein